MAEDLQCCPLLPRDIQSIKKPKESINFLAQAIRNEVPHNPCFGQIAISALSGKIFITDYENTKVHVLSDKREYITSFGTKGEEEGELSTPYEVAISGKLVYVINGKNARRVRIEVFEEDGTFVRQIGKGQPINCPTSLVIHNELLYTADLTPKVNSNLKGYEYIAVYSQEGKFLHQIGKPGQFRGIRSLAISPESHLYLFEKSGEEDLTLQILTMNGHCKMKLDLFDSNCLYLPLDLSNDVLITANSDILVADQKHGRLVVLSPQWHTNTLKVVHSIDCVQSPTSVAIDRDGDILVLQKSSGEVTVL